MKRHFFVCLLLSCVLQVFCQKQSSFTHDTIHLSIGLEKWNRTFYLLGAQQDYMGRCYEKKNPFKSGYLLTIHESHIGEIKRVEEVSDLKFKRLSKKKKSRNRHEFLKLTSLRTARQINHFYEFSKPYEEQNWLFALYCGELQCDKVLEASKENQLSFMAGVAISSCYVRENSYWISLPNSRKRFECLKHLLVEMDAKIISEVTDAETIPHQYDIEFIPNGILKAIIDYELSLKSINK